MSGTQTAEEAAKAAEEANKRPLIDRKPNKVEAVSFVIGAVVGVGALILIALL